MTTTDAFKDKKLIIYINDSDNKMTIPLTFNGTMSISAVKSAEIIY